jgi:hypothetical protein
MTKYDLKRRIKAARKSGGGRFPVDLQQAVNEYAELRQAGGSTFREVAAELGVNWHTMMGWRKRKVTKKKLRRVRVVKPSRRAKNEGIAKTVTVRFPKGVIVDGLDIQQVAELMRSLS